MIASALSVRALLLAIFILMAGSGFLSTLIAIRLEQAGVGALAIGLAATSYFTGLMLGSLRMEALIVRIGHIRAFAACVTVFSASSLAYALLDFTAAWLALRLVDGFAMAGVFICLESWLNRQASPTNRSTVLAAYMIALYCGQASGQFLLNLDPSAPHLPFMVSALLLSLALLPVLLTRMEQPPVEHVTPFSIRRLYAASPLGIVGTLATGVMLGAFYALGAVFVQRIGWTLAEVALFTSLVIAGGVALQYPLGMLSDRFDRRRVIIGCFAAVLAVSMAIWANLLPPSGVMMLGAMFGGFAFALYPLCVAHTNDHLDESERVGASSGLVLIYSLGAMGGPVMGSAGMGWAGPSGLFAAIALVAGLALAFGMGRTIARNAVPAQDQQPFQSLPRTTPMVAVLESEDGPGAGPRSD